MNMDLNSDLSAYAGAGPAANHPDFNVPSDFKMSIDLDLILERRSKIIHELH